jgi:hypothetical protein
MRYGVRFWNFADENIRINGKYIHYFNDYETAVLWMCSVQDYAITHHAHNCTIHDYEANDEEIWFCEESSYDIDSEEEYHCIAETEMEGY